MSKSDEKAFKFTCPECFVTLKARVSQSGSRLACPSCAASIEVPAAPRPKSIAGATDMTIDSSAVEPSGEYGVRAPGAAAPRTPDLMAVACPICFTRTYTARDDPRGTIRCEECGTEMPVVEAPRPLANVQKRQKIDEERVGQYGVRGEAGSAGASSAAASIPFHCRLCETLLYGTTAQVGQEVTCPDCDTRTVVPPPKKVAPKAVMGAAAGEDVGEYGVSEPAKVLDRTPMSAKLQNPPEQDPDFDFLDDVDDPQMRWQLQDRSDELGFFGHPEASRRWLGFCISGVIVFAIPAVVLMLFAKPEQGEMTAVNWFGAAICLSVAGLVCLAWAAVVSANLLAIVQDTSAGNHIVENWPEGDWSEWIGESFYVINGCLVSCIPVAILVQLFPPVYPLDSYQFYMVGFWLVFPVALLSMLETGSVMTPVSGGVWKSIFRRPGAWAWFYLRSLGLVAVAVAMFMAFWNHITGYVTMSVLAPAELTFAMVYFRWVGILGVSVREVIEEAMDEE